MLHMPKSSHGYSLPLKDMNSILLFICEKIYKKIIRIPLNIHVKHIGFLINKESILMLFL